LEIITATKLMPTPPKPVSKTFLMTVAILEISMILVGGLVSAGSGILLLVAILNPEVKAYLKI